MRLQRRGSKDTRRTFSMEGIQGIEERGANEEEDAQKSRGTISPGKGSDSRMFS